MQEETKPCPFCAEQIEVAAGVCRFCNRELAALSAAESALRSQATVTDVDTETKYLETSGVLITNTRAVFSGKTYAVADISSVTMFKLHHDRVFGIGLSLLGMVLMWAAKLFENNIMGVIALIGIACFVAGIYSALTAKAKYYVLMNRSSGEFYVEWGFDQSFMQRITRAMNEAIGHRG